MLNQMLNGMNETPMGGNHPDKLPLGFQGELHLTRLEAIEIRTGGSAVVGTFAIVLTACAGLPKQRWKPH